MACGRERLPRDFCVAHEFWHVYWLWHPCVIFIRSDTNLWQALGACLLLPRCLLEQKYISFIKVPAHVFTEKLFTEKLPLFQQKIVNPGYKLL